MPPGSTTLLTGPRYALKGRVVTMDTERRVIERGLVYIDEARIAAVVPIDAPPPPGFEQAPVINTRGTIYPGLIELHNHLSYNVLRLWDVPKKYTNRDKWAGIEDYRRLISGPMKVLGQASGQGYVEALVRYVECKCLLGGVTTSQGIALYSNSGIRRYYRGAVRNVEQTGVPDLPEASGHIADVEAVNSAKFLQRLEGSTCLLLHMSEGTDPQARQHFADLQMPDGRWAIKPSLAGIHCAALEAEDFATLAANGGAMVWSPLSNLLLYGQTARVAEAKTRGVRIGIGSDWSPSGSKNLLGELKVARLVSADQGGLFTDREIVEMATRNGAGILGWDRALGSLEQGKYADMLVINSQQGDPYATLLEAAETAISMVIVNGVPRYGQPGMMSRFTTGTEEWRVGGAKRLLNLAEEDADPIVGTITLREAKNRLKDGLRRLRELAIELEDPSREVPRGGSAWGLVLDQDAPEDMVMRTYFSEGLRGLEADRGLLPTRAPSVPLSKLLGPLKLDPLTVADDSTFLDRLRQQRNLPDYIKAGLPSLY